MTIQVRSASMADIDELTRLFDQCRVFYERSSDIDLARSYLTERIEKNESQIIIAGLNDDVLWIHSVISVVFICIGKASMDTQ